MFRFLNSHTVSATFRTYFFTMVTITTYLLSLVPVFFMGERSGKETNWNGIYAFTCNNKINLSFPSYEKNPCVYNCLLPLSISEMRNMMNKMVL
jgi:hypothetical protein